MAEGGILAEADQFERVPQRGQRVSEFVSQRREKLILAMIGLPEGILEFPMLILAAADVPLDAGLDGLVERQADGLDLAEPQRTVQLVCPGIPARPGA